MSDSADGLTGIVADRYHVDRKIGQGGMATVYLAHDQRHDSQVALKVLRPELASRLGGERFVREIRITAQLQHPNILPVFDSGEADGNAFYVMPYVEGQTLEQRLKAGPLPLDEALSLAAEVADALAYAHERGFVHRDVKPSNIMLTHGHAMLADFGIARAIDAAGGEQLTEAGLAIGTAAYMSPEQALGQPLDGRTDIYSLGCVLYEMLAGTPPFTGSARVILARHSADTVPSLRVVRDTVPEPIELLVFKALAKTPADRFANAAAFRDALRQAGTATITATIVRSEQKTSMRRTLAWSASVVLAIAVIAIAQFSGFGLQSVDLDPNRVLVLPLTVSEGFEGGTTGEDVATLIINMLDGAGSLRWIDGLARLNPAERDDFRAPGVKEARAMARADRAAYFVTGSITPIGNDQVSVGLALYDTETGDVIRTAAPPATESATAWRSAIGAANELLSALISGSPDVEAEWRDRQPRAIASFLRAESEFRRLHLEESLRYYREAVAQDSTFVLAAIRGAQVAGTWAHRPGEAETMIRTALRQSIPPRYADFARGYAAHLEGNADSAVAAMQRAVVANPGMAAAWMQLGEAYTHLLPKEGDPDSLALFAFEEARRLEPTATNQLFHVIEIRLRRGEIDVAESLLTEFRAADPDTALVVKLDMMHACVRDGPAQVPWEQLATDDPLALLRSAKSLSAGAAQPECARAGFRALLAFDTAATGDAAGRRYASLTGLYGLLVSAGRDDEAVAVIDSALARGHGSLLTLVGAYVNDALAQQATGVAADMRSQFATYSDWPRTEELWAVGIFEASQGNSGEAEIIAAELEARAAATGSDRSRMMAQSVAAHVAQARGQTDEATRLFDALVPARVPAEALSWDEVAPLGADRLALARLLVDQREYSRANSVAFMFDSQAPMIYPLYVRSSLELRIDAAKRMGESFLASRLTARLDALK